MANDCYSARMPARQLAEAREVGFDQRGEFLTGAADEIEAERAQFFLHFAHAQGTGDVGVQLTIILRRPAGWWRPTPRS